MSVVMTSKVWSSCPTRLITVYSSHLCVLYRVKMDYVLNYEWSPEVGVVDGASSALQDRRIVECVYSGNVFLRLKANQSVHDQLNVPFPSETFLLLAESIASLPGVKISHLSGGNSCRTLEVMYILIDIFYFNVTRAPQLPKNNYDNQKNPHLIK